MSHNQTNQENSVPIHIMERKRDQEFELAGLARQDGDTPDEKLHTDKAREWGKKIREYYSGGE
jgi:hypothetical protein